jgi:hypothetical protein
MRKLKTGKKVAGVYWQGFTRDFTYLLPKITVKMIAKLHI